MLRLPLCLRCMGEPQPKSALQYASHSRPMPVECRLLCGEQWRGRARRGGRARCSRRQLPRGSPALPRWCTPPYAQRRRRRRRRRPRRATGLPLVPRHAAHPGNTMALSRKHPPLRPGRRRWAWGQCQCRHRHQDQDRYRCWHRWRTPLRGGGCVSAAFRRRDSRRARGNEDFRGGRHGACWLFAWLCGRRGRHGPAALLGGHQLLRRSAAVPSCDVSAAGAIYTTWALETAAKCIWLQT